MDESGRDGCGWSSRESYSAKVPGQHKASRLQQCERHGSVALVQDGAERCAMVRDAGSYCNNAEVREGALVSDRGSFSIEGVSNLTEMSDLGDQLLTSQQLGCSTTVSSDSAMGNMM